MVYPVGNLFIPAEHGQIEALLKEPAGNRQGTALVLHPHPVHGGTMHNKVVFRIASALNDAGLAVLRINFRGVGHSTGAYDEGRGEQDDVSAGLSYLAGRFPDDPITLAGFSFGARVGLEVGVTDERVTNLIAVGTPLDMYDFSFLQRCRKPILFVHGENDEFGRIDLLRSIADNLRSQARVAVQVIPNAGHFFDGKLDELKQKVTDWILQEAKLSTL